MSKVNSKLINIILGIMLLISIGALAYTAVNLGVVTGQFAISAAISFAVFFVILLFYKKWLKGFYNPIKNVIEELSNFKQKFNNMEGNDMAISMLRDNQDKIFSNKYLSNCLERYLEEIERLEVDNAESYRCDISDYINYDNICEYVKKNYADNIAASMTGIGLLGTFVGLAVGLQSFDASSMGSMESSISPLIDGIKTAFYTSIYGVVVSLLLNYCLKECVHDLDLALDEFYDFFYENVLSYPEYLIQKQSLQIQQDQRDILANFAETMAVSLSREMKDLMVPLFEKMSETMDNFSTNIAKSQTDGLGKIVDGFVENMNESLGNQFDNLSDVIKETCEWQKAATESMDRVVEAIKAEAQDIAEIDVKLKETIVKFDEYLGKLIEQEHTLSAQLDVYEDTLETTMRALENTQNNVSNMLEQHDSLIKAEEMTNESVKESVSSIKEVNEVMAEGTKKTTDLVEAFMREMREFNNSEIQRMEEHMSVAGERMNAAAEKLAGEYEKLQSDIDITMSRTFSQFDKEMANITSYIGSALDEVNGNTEKMPIVVNRIFDKLKEETEKYILKVTDINESLNKAAEDMSRTSRRISEHLSSIQNKAGEK